MFVVASKEAVLGFKKSDIRLFILLVLVSVFEKRSMVCRGFIGAVVSLVG